MKDVGSFKGQLSCLVTQVTAIPEIGSCNEPITDLSQFQPTRRQLVFACKFLNGWAQTHPLRRTRAARMNTPTAPKYLSIEINDVIRSTIRLTNAALCLPAVSPFRCASRPGNGDQKSALLQRFDVVVYAVVECHQFPGGKVDLLIREMNANLALQ